MSKCLGSLLLILIIAACSSPAPKNTPPTDYPSTPVVAPPNLNDKSSESSEVLNKNKKCPRKTKMVNGKCLLQVESAD